MLASAMILTSSVLIPAFTTKFKPIGNGAIVIHRGSIVDIGKATSLIRKYPSQAVYSLENAVLMPGLVNAHTHLELPPLLNKIRTKRFPDWVLGLIRVKRKIAFSDYVDNSKKNIETLIRTGTTTVAEICTHHASPEPLILSGLRAVIFHEVISMDPSSVLPVLPQFMTRPSTRVHVGISPHAPHTVSAAVLRGLKKRYSGLRFCMHVAESRDEIELLRTGKGGFLKIYKMAGWNSAWAPRPASPFQYLHDLGMLDSLFTAVHAVYATSNDIGLIKKAGLCIVHCPRSNRETGVGKISLKLFLDAGIPVALGTDSLASSPSLSMWDEMRFAYRLHRHSGTSAADIFKSATLSGARSLGLDGRIGTLERGKRADIIAVPLPTKTTGDLYSDLIRETRYSIMTMVDGNFLSIDKTKNDSLSA